MAWDTAVLEDGAVADSLTLAVKAEKKAADEWQTVVRVLKGQLTQRFPRNPEKVASFFPPKRAAVVAASPAETTAQDEAVGKAKG